MADAGASNSQNVIKEYVIMAAPKQKGASTFLGRFPLGIPDLTPSKSECNIKKEEQDESGVLPGWLIEDRPGHVAQRGTIANPSSNVGYFVLKGTGPNQLTSIVVDDWYNFRPVVQHEVPSLEDAEELMRRGKRPHVAKSISEKLNRVAMMNSREGSTEEGGEKKVDSDDSEYDEERERKPKRKKQGKGARGGDKSEKNEDLSSGEEDAVPEEKIKPDGVEDWEYEEDVADDDLNMGEVNPDDDAEAEAELRKFVGSDSSDEEEEQEAEELNDSAKRIKKLLKKTGLESDSDKDEEVDDLDEMAAGAGALLERATASRANKRKIAETSGKEKKDDSKSKPEKSKSGKDSASKDDSSPSSKRAKTSNPSSNASKSSSSPKSKAGNQKPGDPKSIDIHEIVRFLRSHGPLPLGELISAFRKIIKSREDNKEFITRVKKVATFMEHPEGSGKKLVCIKKKLEK
ncbi:hypothetical protein BSKO_04387 [Bryopsis sp. KO-2023]|nr:hypothetical protein BSKO_04387 [Bryopsis sp. KO-2023]